MQSNRLIKEIKDRTAHAHIPIKAMFVVTFLFTDLFYGAQNYLILLFFFRCFSSVVCIINLRIKILMFLVLSISQFQALPPPSLGSPRSNFQKL